MRLLLVAVLCLFTSLARAGEPVLIAAAADLKFALDDVLAEFSKTHPELEPKVTYGSSGTLFQQIENGAPFDLFLSADAKLPRKLIENGRGDQASFFLYAQGHLVVWVPAASKLISRNSASARCSIPACARWRSPIPRSPRMARRRWRR